MNTQAKKKAHKRKYEGDENQHLHYSKSQKLVRERNRKAKLRKNPAMSIFEAGRERTKRIVKKEYPSINLNKPPSSIASLSTYTPRNKKNDDKSNKDDKDHKPTIYKRTTFRLPIREPSAQNFDMYYYLAPNREPATVKNILELYDETKLRLQEKKALKAGLTTKTTDKSKDAIVKNKENNMNASNHKSNILNASKLNKSLLPLSSKENLPNQKRNGKENKGVLTKSNMNASNVLKSSTKCPKAKDGKSNPVKTELDDNKENIPPLHHNQNSSTTLQFVDYPSNNSTTVGTLGLTSDNKTEQEEKDKDKIDTNLLNKVKKEKGQEDESETKQQRKTKPIIVNTVSDEDLEEFFRVFDDLIPMYRSSTQLQDVIFETSQKEWNEWCYKVEQCEEETHSWLDARIMFYSRRIIEYQKDWAEYWNKKRKKEKEMLELTSDLSSDSLCPNTPSSTSLLPDSIKLLGSSPLPNLTPFLNTSNTFNIPFQTPDDSSMLTSSEATPTKSSTGADLTANPSLANVFMGTEDLDLTNFSLDSNQDLLSSMPLLYDTSSGQPGYPNMDYGLDSTSSFDSLDPLSSATINNDYCNWLGSNPSSSLSMDDILFNTTTPSDPSISLLLNSLQTNTTNANLPTVSSIPTAASSLNFLNPLVGTTPSLNPALSIFDTTYHPTTSANDNLLIPSSLVELPSVSTHASLMDSFAQLNGTENVKTEEENAGIVNGIKKESKIDDGSKENQIKKEAENQASDAEKLKMNSTNALVDPSMTTLLTNELGLEALFNETVTAPKMNEKIANSDDVTVAGSHPSLITDEAITDKPSQTPEMTIKTVTDALITPTKPKEVNPTIDFFVDNTIAGNKKTSEFATPLYIKPPTVDTFSSIPKSYQEMYNDKMYSLISTLERCVQDKEDFWKVMEEFTSSIITHSTPIAC